LRDTAPQSIDGFYYFSKNCKDGANDKFDIALNQR